MEIHSMMLIIGAKKAAVGDSCSPSFLFILRIWKKKTGKEYSFARELACIIVLSTFFYLGLVATVLAAAGRIK